MTTAELTREYREADVEARRLKSLLVQGKIKSTADWKRYQLAQEIRAWLLEQLISPTKRLVG